MSHRMVLGSPGFPPDAVQQSHQHSAEIVRSAARNQELRSIVWRAQGEHHRDSLLPVLLVVRTSHFHPLFCPGIPVGRWETSRGEIVRVEHARIEDITI